MVGSKKKSLKPVLRESVYKQREEWCNREGFFAANNLNLEFVVNCLSRKNEYRK